MARSARPGNGEPLKPVTGWEGIWRGVFETRHAGTDYAIAVDYFDLGEKVHLYETERRVATMSSPARFDVPGGRIEATFSLYGLKRAHLVTDAGDEHAMTPAPGTGERWRQGLHDERPGLSRFLSVVSWTVLVLGLALSLPDWAGGILPRLGVDFVSPINLPDGVSSVISILTIAAGIERALMLRHHWLLDG